VAGQGFNFDVNYKEWLELGIGANYTLNSITYKNRSVTQTLLQNDQYSSWTITSNASITMPKDWILKYDFEFVINHGLTGIVGKNAAVMNASIEKMLFKKKNGIIRLHGFDLFNQGSNINRSIVFNSIIDSRSNRLNRYFMLTFTYRLQKFNVKQGQQKSKGNLIRL
jgi:hypothetical protein